MHLGQGHHANETGQLVIHTKHPAVPLVYLLSPPAAIINQVRVPLKWGENLIPCHAAVHHVSISTALSPAAGITVDNRHRPAERIYYAKAWLTWDPPAIDHRPVNCPGEIGHLVGFALFALFSVAIATTTFPSDFSWAAIGGAVLSALLVANIALKRRQVRQPDPNGRH